MIGHVFKYPLLAAMAGKIIEINMPEKYAICDIAFQGSDICIWAMVDIHAPLIPTKFVIYGTGWKIDDVENLFFMKTVHMPDGLVWHVFKVLDKDE